MHYHLHTLCSVGSNIQKDTLWGWWYFHCSKNLLGSPNMLLDHLHCCMFLADMALARVNQMGSENQEDRYPHRWS